MTSLYVDTNTLNVGIGTRIPTHLLHIEGNAKLTGGFVDANNQPIWIPASTLEWKPTPSPPALTLPASGVFNTTTQTALYRYFGRELSYAPTISGIVTTQPTSTAQDYLLSLPFPVDSNIYTIPTIVGELWLNVQSGLSSNTFKSYARTIPSNLSNVTLRALTGTTDESLSTILATSRITLQGNLTYATPFINNLSPIPSTYIPATFAQDQVGKVALNTGGNPPRAQLDIITNSNTPALVVDQKGAGNIVEFLDVGVKKIVIDGNGNVGIGTTLAQSILDVNGTVRLGQSGFSLSILGCSNPIILGGALSDETTALATTNTLTLNAPFNFNIRSLKLPKFTINTAATSTITFDITKNGTTIFSSKPTITTSNKYSINGTLTVDPTPFSENDVIIASVNVAGTGGTGAKVYVYCT
jgi:hypothetical protein